MSETERPSPGTEPASESIEQQPGFPREEMTRLVRHLPAYARLAWALARDPRLSKARRAVVVAGAAYVLSPIDAIPGIVPVLGQLDDIAIALGVIRVALDGLKPEVRAQRLAEAGLSQQDLADDIAATKATVGWLARSGIRAGRRVLGAAAQTGSRVGERARQVGGGLAEQAGQRAPELGRHVGRLGQGLRRRIGR
jgi:uncharacterized membrane protein YkvA (DUF1232 family)